MTVVVGVTSTTWDAFDEIFFGDYPTDVETVTILSGQGTVDGGQVLVKQLSSGKYKKYAVPTAITSESLGTGDGTTKTFSGTAAHKNIAPTTFQVTTTISSASVVLYDDGEGNLKDSGGTHTGSINYVTGAWSLSYATAPDNTAAITAAYSYFADYYGAHPEIVVSVNRIQVDATSADKSVEAARSGSFNKSKLSPSLTSDTWLAGWLDTFSTGLYLH